MSSTDSRVDQMFRILLDPDEKDVEKQQKVLANWHRLAAGLKLLNIRFLTNLLVFTSSGYHALILSDTKQFLRQNPWIG